MPSNIGPDQPPDHAAIPENTRDRAQAFLDAAAEIDRRASPETGECSPPGSEAGALEECARESGRLIFESAFANLEVVSNSTSEHEVFFRERDARAVKRTWPGVFGQIPAPIDGKLGRKNATAPEYLRRMAFQTLIFESDLRFEGVTISDRPPMVLFQPPRQPSLVVSQSWLESGGRVTLDEIEALFQESGFSNVPNSYFGWFRSEDRIAIVDAKPDNFIKTSVGLVPIDLQIVQFSKAECQAAGLI